MVLNTNRQVGPLESQGRVSPLLRDTGGMSLVLRGLYRAKSPICARYPLSRLAEQQKSGNKSWCIIAAFKPCDISASSSEPCSKYFSISVSSCTAMASINWSAGFVSAVFFGGRNGQFLWFAAVGTELVHRHFEYVNNGIEAAPLFRGYCTTVTASPNRCLACSTVASKSAFSPSHRLTTKIMGVLNFSVYSQTISEPTSTPLSALSTYNACVGDAQGWYDFARKIINAWRSWTTLILWSFHSRCSTESNTELPRWCSSSV